MLKDKTFRCLKKQTATIIYFDKFGHKVHEGFGITGRLFEPGDILPKKFMDVVAEDELERRMKKGLIEEVQAIPIMKEKEKTFK